MQTHIDYTGLEKLLGGVAAEGRQFLYEYEVYRFVTLLGGETPPHNFLLKKGQRFDGAVLDTFPGSRVVIKVVSPHILHKSDVGGVRICEKEPGAVLSTIRKMSCEIPDRFADQVARGHLPPLRGWEELTGDDLTKTIAEGIEGYLICQYMRPDSEQFGGELLIGLRNTREFGMIFSAGLGGRDTELYARRFRKGQAVVSSSVEMVDGETFFDLFRGTISYKKLAGLTRGQQRIVTDDQLLECFSAFIEVGRYFSASRPESPFLIEELEINPFAFSDFLMMPLDGLCKFESAHRKLAPRPIPSLDRMLHPHSIGVVGASGTKVNIGRIILQNILGTGFDPQKISVIHPGCREIENIETVPDLSALRSPVDLLILAVSGNLVPGLLDMVMENGLARSVLLVSSNLGEKEDEEERTRQLRHRLEESRRDGEDVPVLLGANSLGILSRPGRFDSMFIPENKLPKVPGDHKRTAALVSQSGAYLITRMSRLSFLDPAYAISVGNQVDLTVGDFLHFFNTVENLKTLGFYVEGFNRLDGLSCLRAISKAKDLGKEVIFYKAGRTPEGKDALSGHTASIAGDYEVCEGCIDQAGAMVAETFSEFEGLLQLSHRFHDRRIGGNRLAAVSNAGYEAVGIADNILGEGFRLKMAEYAPATRTKLAEIFADAGLSHLTGVSAPLDITPMATEEVYGRVIGCLLEDPGIDAVIAAIVPLTPMLHTLPEELADERDLPESSLVEIIANLWDSSSKPVVIVVDSGPLYDPMATSLQERGLVVFRSADIAVRVLGKYLHYRLG